MPLFFKVNQSTGEIVASYNVPSDSCVPAETGFDAVQVAIGMIDLYASAPAGKKAIWSNNTVVYQ